MVSSLYWNIIATTDYGSRNAMLAFALHPYADVNVFLPLNPHAHLYSIARVHVSHQLAHLLLCTHAVARG